jgi:hypothetical protein
MELLDSRRLSASWDQTQRFGPALPAPTKKILSDVIIGVMQLNRNRTQPNIETGCKSSAPSHTLRRAEDSAPGFLPLGFNPTTKESNPTTVGLNRPMEELSPTTVGFEDPTVGYNPTTVPPNPTTVGLAS